MSVALPRRSRHGQTVVFILPSSGQHGFQPHGPSHRSRAAFDPRDVGTGLRKRPSIARLPAVTSRCSSATTNSSTAIRFIAPRAAYDDYTSAIRVSSPPSPGLRDAHISRIFFTPAHDGTCVPPSTSLRLRAARSSHSLSGYTIHNLTIRACPRDRFGFSGLHSRSWAADSMGTSGYHAMQGGSFACEVTPAAELRARIQAPQLVRPRWSPAQRLVPADGIPRIDAHEGPIELHASAANSIWTIARQDASKRILAQEAGSNTKRGPHSVGLSLRHHKIYSAPLPSLDAPRAGAQASSRSGRLAGRGALDSASATPELRVGSASTRPRPRIYAARHPADPSLTSLRAQSIYALLIEPSVGAGGGGWRTPCSFDGTNKGEHGFGSCHGSRILYNTTGGLTQVIRARKALQQRMTEDNSWDHSASLRAVYRDARGADATECISDRPRAED